MPETVEPEAPEKNASLLDINIVEQIEYYFGDFNIGRDKFLKHEITKDEGWVGVSTLLRCNRLAALTKDVDVIMAAFKKNPTSLVEVDEDRKCIRRNPERPIPEHNEEWRSLVAERTIYVKGFPTETTTMDDILKFMSTFGKIDNVFIRKYYDKALKDWKFKGSIFVAFPSKEDAEKFMSIGSVKYAGNELVRKWQNDYIEDKKSERLKLKLEAKELKNQLLKEQQEELKKDMRKLPRGALISLSGLKSEITLNDLKQAAIKLGWDSAFIDYNMGDSTAYIRLQTADSAKDALAKLTNGSFEVKSVSVKAELVEGDQETTILEKMEEERNSRMMHQLLKSKGKKGKGKKNKFGKQGRNGDRDGGKKGEKMEEESAEEDKNDAQSSEGGVKRKSDDENREDVAKKSKSEPK